MKIAQSLVNITVVGLLGLTFTGCSSMKEMLQAVFEVKTVEKQGNRASVGMTIVRQNNIMLEDLEISGAAKWPKAIAADISDKDKSYINKILNQDAYYATKHLTFARQKRVLGGSLGGVFGDLGVSALTYRAYKNMMVLFGENPIHWPNILASKIGFTDFLKFEEDKDRKLVTVESGEGDLHKNIGEAVIALTPDSFQKQLNPLRESFADTVAVVETLNAEKGDLETQIKSNEIELAKKADKRKDGFTALTAAEITKIEADVEVYEPKIEAAELKAEEAEEAYFLKLDEAVEALKSDIKLNPEQVKLAQNVAIAADNVQNGSGQAGTMFAIALVNGISAFYNFDYELATLTINVNIPHNLHELYGKRQVRVLRNALFLFPNIAMGSFYAVKQASLASKYKEVAEVIVDAYDIKMEQEKAVAEAKKEAVAAK